MATGRAGREPPAEVPPSDAAEPLMTIGEVARVAQVTTSALRFYEAEQLVVPVSRTPAGYRL